MKANEPIEANNFFFHNYKKWSTYSYALKAPHYCYQSTEFQLN